MNLRAASAALLTCLAVDATWAAPVSPEDKPITTYIGGQFVTLPMPNGFVESDSTASALRDSLASNYGPPFRLIAVAMPREWVEKLNAHASPELEPRYCVMMTYRDYEAAGMSPAMFEGVKKTMREQGEELLQRADGQNAGAKGTDDDTAKLFKSANKMLGVFDEQPDSIAFASIIKNFDKSHDESHDQVTVMALVLVHRKPMTAAFSSNYDSKADLVWAEGEARDWIRRVHALNP